MNRIRLFSVATCLFALWQFPGVSWGQSGCLGSRPVSYSATGCSGGSMGTTRTVTRTRNVTYAAPAKASYILMPMPPVKAAPVLAPVAPCPAPQQMPRGNAVPMIVVPMQTEEPQRVFGWRLHAAVGFFAERKPVRTAVRTFTHAVLTFGLRSCP